MFEFFAVKKYYNIVREKIKLIDLYKILLNYFGPQEWWPAETPFEVVVGAILTQQTNWKNVEKAIDNLRKNNLLDLEKLALSEDRTIEELIRPVGYFREKTKKLKRVVSYIYENYQGDLQKFFSRPLENLRQELLSLYGIGFETADSILLYAAEKPIFVIDAYTRRIVHRLGITHLSGYEQLGDYFEKSLPKDVELYQEFHALLVELGKRFCKTEPLCAKCPLNEDCQKVS